MDSLAINVHLLPVKASYFCMLGAVASLLPFLTVYMRQAGLSEIECAAVYGTMPFIGAFIRPLFGAVADAWKKHKVILAVCCVMTAIFHGLLLAVPHHKYGAHGKHWKETASSDMWMTLNCYDDGSTAQFCPKEILKHRGCTTKPFNRSEWDLFQPNTDMRNCSLRCYFEPDTNMTQLCLHRGNTVDCPFYKDDQNHIKTLPTITKQDHLHRFHHLYNDFFAPSVTFEIENFTLRDPKLHGWSHDTEMDYCYQYELQKIQYNETEYEVSHTGITCDVSSKLKCLLDCDKLPDIHYFEDECPVVAPPIGWEHTQFGRIFWMYFLLYLVAQIWFAPLFGLNDGIVYDHLGEERNRWGQQRLWGTVGFFIFAFVSGLAMDIFSDNITGAGKKNYAPAFALFIGNMLIAAIVVMTYKISPEVRASQICKRVTEILHIPDVLALLAVVFVFGMYTGVIETFLFWHLQDLGAPQYLLGLCMVVNCIPEIFILMFAGYILNKLGYVNALYVVLVTYFVRMLTYSFIRSPWLVLIVEPLHSITFGLMYAAASGYASQVTPNGMHGTVQGLMSGLHFGIGKGVGALVGGWMASWSEMHLVFRYFAVSALVVLALYVTFNVLHNCVCLRRHRGRRLPTSDDKTDQNGHNRNGSASSRDAEPEGARLSTLLDDFSVGFDKDNQALVFKDDPNA